MRKQRVDVTDYSFAATQRRESLFAADWRASGEALAQCFEGAGVLVVGGAGSIGAATVRRLLALGPRRIHVADIDENGLARLARAVMSEARPRSEMFYLAADFGAYPMQAHLEAAGPFDVVLDFAAIKHVRSEKSVAALLHMLDVNIVRQQRFFDGLARGGPPKRLFAVSTDKAADPANFMGATKRLLEELLRRAGRLSPGMRVGSARFANVAFSAGSLLESFPIRLAARRPLALPQGTRRFFISAEEAAEICLLATALCRDAQPMIPRPSERLPSTELAAVAERFLAQAGEKAVFLHDAAAADAHLARGLPGYPVLLTPLDTAGEKDEEIFIAQGETPVELGLAELFAVRTRAAPPQELDAVCAELAERVAGRRKTGSAAEIEALLARVVGNFRHAAATLSLDDRV